MAKSLISFAGILLLILFSGVTAIAGIVMMTMAIISSNGQFLQGLEVFFLGSISFSVTLIGYTASKILKNTDIIAECMEDTLEVLDAQQRKNPLSSLASLLGGAGGTGGFPMNGTMRVARMDKDGNITSMGEKSFENHEEFLKFRDELINNAMNKNGKKKVSEMSLEELEAERETAEKAQDFELAAALRDAIIEKKKKKD